MDIKTTENKITMTCGTKGAIIRYTLDGSEPDESSLVYSDPFEIEPNMVIKARAYKDGLNPSDVVFLDTRNKEIDMIKKTLDISGLNQKDVPVNVTGSTEFVNSLMDKTIEGKLQYVLTGGIENSFFLINYEILPTVSTFHFLVPTTDETFYIEVENDNVTLSGGFNPLIEYESLMLIFYAEMKPVTTSDYITENEVFFTSYGMQYVSESSEVKEFIGFPDWLDGKVTATGNSDSDLMTLGKLYGTLELQGLTLQYSGSIKLTFGDIEVYKLVFTNNDVSKEIYASKYYMGFKDLLMGQLDITLGGYEVHLYYKPDEEEGGDTESQTGYKINGTSVTLTFDSKDEEATPDFFNSNELSRCIKIKSSELVEFLKQYYNSYNEDYSEFKENVYKMVIDGETYFNGGSYLKPSFISYVEPEEHKYIALSYDEEQGKTMIQMASYEDSLYFFFYKVNNVPEGGGLPEYETPFVKTVELSYNN